MGELRQYRIQLLALALVFGLSFVPYIAFAGFVEEKVFGLVVGVTGLMVGLGGGILDAGINLFVIRFGDFFLNSGMGVAVNNTWVIIRDFMNLMFIFGLVYIGFKMILGTDTSNSRRWLVNLILAALLINFSLFITKFVIDFSNQMTTEIALAAFNTEDSKNGDGSPTKKVTMSKDLQVRMGITSLLNTGDKNKGILKGDNAWGYIFGTGIFFLITAFVYAAGGILLMIRFAVLNLYMVMSPLLFISWILPPLSGVAAKHWKAFFSKCFFAPVYLLFVYFSLQILDGFQTALPGLGGGEMTNIVSAGSGGATAAAAQSTLPFFILICIFMIASLVVAQKMGAEGAGQAVSMLKSARNRVQRSVTKGAQNTGKFAAAQTAGRAARFTSNATGAGTEALLRRAQTLQGGGLNKFVRGVARSNAVQGSVGGAATSMQKAKFGLKRTEEEEVVMSRQTNKQADNAMALSSGVEAQRLIDAKKAGKITVNNRGITQEEDLANMTPERRTALGLDASDDDLNKQVEAAKKAAEKLNTKDIEAMTEKEQEQVAQFLSGSQTESILKSDKISDEQKDKIKDAQKEAIEKMVTENGQIITEKLTNLSIRQIEALGEDFILKHATSFSDSQFADLKKSKAFTERQTGNFNKARKDGFSTKIAGTPSDVESIFEIKTYDEANKNIGQKTKKVAEISKLPGNVLADKKAIPYLTVDVLKAIANGDKEYDRISTDQREAIMQNLTDAAGSGRAISGQAQKALDYINSPKGLQDFLGRG